MTLAVAHAACGFEVADNQRIGRTGRQAARRDAGGARTLPARLLHRCGSTSTASWTRCSRTMWICAGRTEEIERPGQFFVREVPATAIIVTRSRTAACSAFYNVCRHRGTRLCTERTGTFARQHPVPVSRLDLRPRRPADRRAAHGRGAALPQGGLSRCTACTPRSWDGHVFLNLDRDAAAARGAARPICPASSARGGWRICAWAAGSSTTSRPTGS